jgi:hypothetical protein
LTWIRIVDLPTDALSPGCVAPEAGGKSTLRLTYVNLRLLTAAVFVERAE